MPGVGAWWQFTLLNRNGGFASEEVAPLLLDMRHFVMDTSGAPPDLGGGGDEEAATGEDAPFHVGEEAVTKGKQSFTPGLGLSR